MQRFFTLSIAVFIGVLAALQAHSALEAGAMRHAIENPFSPALWGIEKTPMASRPTADAKAPVGACQAGHARGTLEATRDGKTERQVICVAPIR